MSEREALATLQSVVRSVVRVCRDETIRGLLEVALADAEAIADRPSSDALRKRRIRGQPVPDIPGHSRTDRDIPGHATGGIGGALSSDLKSPEGECREGGPAASRTTADIPGHSERRIRNATDDGAAGMTVSAWCEGISDATGRPCTSPTHGMVRQLIECQQKHRPVTEEPVEWSRKSAAEYAKAMSGRELSVFGYTRWLDSGKPVGQRDSKPADVLHHEGPAVLAERKRRAEQYRDAEKNRAPMPAALGELLKLPANSGGKT